MKKQIAAWVALLLIIALELVATSCTTTKHIAESEHQSDDIYKKKSDSLELLLSQKDEQYKHDLEQAKTTSVVFKNVPCPMLPNIDSNCNRDSLVKVIRLQNDYIATLQNKVKINADGSIEAWGQVQSANAQLQQRESELDELHSINITLQERINSLLAQKTVTDTSSTRDVQRRWFTSWWLWVIFIIVGYWLRGKFNISSLFINKKPTT